MVLQDSAFKGCVMSRLPSAVHQSPACGACGGDTRCDRGVFICEDCQLRFDPDDLGASFLDPKAETCGVQCSNYWHADHLIERGRGFDCGTCRLPSGHQSHLHWTNCQPRPALTE